MKYYRLLHDSHGVNKKFGIAIAPEHVNFNIIEPGKEVINWKKIIFNLEDGEFADYLGNDLVFNIVSSNFKEAIANTVSDIEKESIQWQTLNRLI